MNFGGALAPKAFTKCGMNKCLHRGFLLTEEHDLPAPLPAGAGPCAGCWGPGSPHCLSCHLAGCGISGTPVSYLCAEQCLPICLSRGLTWQELRDPAPCAAEMGPP